MNASHFVLTEKRSSSVSPGSWPSLQDTSGSCCGTGCREPHQHVRKNTDNIRYNASHTPADAQYLWELADQTWRFSLVLSKGCHGREMPITWLTGLMWGLTWTTSPPTHLHCSAHRKSSNYLMSHLTSESVQLWCFPMIVHNFGALWRLWCVPHRLSYILTFEALD